MKLKAGMNGFGRFGLHLLKYWIERNEKTAFKIAYINDDFLTINDAVKIIVNDKSVSFNKYKIKVVGDFLVILEPNGNKHEIYYTNINQKSIPWIGKPDIFFECSGKYTIAKENKTLLKDKTQTVLISATSWDAEKTIVYGFNHEEYHSNIKIASYGSCTVNAYFPFHKWIDQRYGIINSDVNVIHNIPEYQLDSNNTLNRKFCTLEKQAKMLIESCNDDNFLVNYTVVPYSGVSLIDFRFQLKNIETRDKFIKSLEEEISQGSLKNLYGINEKDLGPEVHNCTVFSTVFIKEGIKVIGENVYLQGYFDNENSVNRFYDLAQYICE